MLLTEHVPILSDLHALHTPRVRTDLQKKTTIYIYYCKSLLNKNKKQPIFEKKINNKSLLEFKIKYKVHSTW